MKAQFHIHGWRLPEKKGTAVNANIAARFANALGYGTRVRYRNHDVYFVHDANTDPFEIAQQIEACIKENSLDSE